jgi:hypothetical protein
MIGLVGAEGSGKRVMTTVLVKQLRTTAATRFNADIRIAADNPEGQQGVAAYRQREMQLYDDHHLPMKTEHFSQRQQAAPFVLRWRQATERRLGGLRLRSAMLALMDHQQGEDLADAGSALTRDYLSACDGLIITLDPFSFLGARARLDLPAEVPRGFNTSALEVLAAEPDYGNGVISARGVMPHRVEDPVLWLLASAGTVPSV